MTWPYDMVFEVRTTGNDNNGGGFSRSGSGTDYSQQDAPVLNQTDLEIHSTDDTKVKDTAGNIGANHVGNVIHITGGTGFYPGWYYCKMWDGTWMTLAYTSIAAGTVGSTGGSFRIGGCFASVKGAMDMFDSVYAQHYTTALKDSIIWVKSGTYNHTATLAPTSQFGSYGYPTRLIGYNTTRGDLDSPFLSWMGVDNRPVLEWTAAVNGWDPTNEYKWNFSNLIFDGTNTGLKGINVNQFTQWVNCLFKDWTEYGMYGGAYNVLNFVEIDNCGNLASGYAGIRFANNSFLHACWIHNCEDDGVFFQGTVGVAERCIFSNNGGIGLNTGGWGTRVTNDLFYGNGSHGLLQNSYQQMQSVRDNIFYGNGGYGLDWSSTSMSDFEFNSIANNAFGNNTSGRSDQNPGIDYIDLTADPFTDVANDDYTLNNAAGGGALLRGAGFNNLDVGPLQHVSVQSNVRQQSIFSSFIT